MILVDTGPIVALFDARDEAHVRCRAFLRSVRQPLVTTLPVLTEAFHLLDPASLGAVALAQFVTERGVGVRDLDAAMLTRALELMAKYRDHPMDLADASLVVLAEASRALTVWTLDRNDFAAYRARVGRSWRALRVIDSAR